MSLRSNNNVTQVIETYQDEVYSDSLEYIYNTNNYPVSAIYFYDGEEDWTDCNGT